MDRDNNGWLEEIEKRLGDAGRTGRRGFAGMLAAGALAAASARGAERNAGNRPPMLGGCGGAYFLAGTGELWVEVEKQDLNADSRQIHLRAILFGPDRTVLDEGWIADDGKPEGSGPGPVRKVLLRTKVSRPGVYGLNVTVTNDRYGDGMSWSFRTNCPRWLIETSRGHKDARHEEPIVLRSPERPGNICFLPEPGEKPVAVEAVGLAGGVADLRIYDAADREILVLPVSPDGAAKGEIPAGTTRGNIPWRLHVPKAQGEFIIDGLTRWTLREWDGLSLWTPDRATWFPFHEHRWLLTPYRRTVYTGAEPSGTVPFVIHNNGTAPKRVALALEFDRNGKWPATLSAAEITVKPGASATVSLVWKLPAGGAEWNCRLRASSLDGSRFSTWSSVTLRRGTAPAENGVAVPITLKPYSHENEQFGYLPDYPLDNQVYFDLDNRPFVSATDGIISRRGGKWSKTSSARRGDTGATVSIRPANTRVAFDRDNDVYCLGVADGATMLLQSRDHGATFTAWPLPGSGTFDIEAFSGHNLPAGPPPVARLTLTAADPDRIWRRINDFDLFLPSKGPDGAIEVGAPLTVSKMCIGLAIHSGMPNVMASRGNKIHLVWGEATDPEANAPGVPTFAATCDRAARTLSEPALVGYGPPANDIHNTPCITVDGEGYLHVLVGTHGRTFKYSRSLAPDQADGGWTPAEDVGPGLLQTYVGMACDRNNTLHLVFRLARTDTRLFPAGYYSTLSSMRKRPGEPWSEPRDLVAPAFSEYCIYYHRLTIDRRGALFLSYDYWSTFWFYRTDHRGNHRALLTSPDGGDTWRLVPSGEMG